MARIVLYTGYGDAKTPWNARSMSSMGMGGTETAVVYAADQLVAKGHTVFVVGSNIESDVIDGVIYSQTDDFFKDNILIFDTVIGVGYLHFVKLFQDNKALVSEWILWQHNTEPYYWYNGVAMSEEDRQSSLETLDSIWVPSEWTKDNYSLDPQKTIVVPNGINCVEQKQWKLDKFDNIEQLEVIWSSCVSRNLSYVLDIWPTVISLIPNAKLHVCHPSYSSNIDPGTIDRVRDLSMHPSSGIVYHGSMDKSSLYDLMSTSHVWLYPTDYEETFCITALEMISHGVIPCITTGSNLSSFVNLLPARSCNLGYWSDTPKMKRSILQLLIDVYSGGFFNDDTVIPTLYHSSGRVREDYDWGVIGSHINDCIRNNFIQKPTQLVECVYIITSDYGAADRQCIPNGMVNRLRKMGISGIRARIVPAIDGRLITQEILQQHGFQLFPWKLESSTNSWWNRDMTPGEIGCALSHMYCWYHAQQNNVNGILVLEDDFFPTTTVHELFDERTVPSDWDLLYLGRNALADDTEFGHESLVKPGYSYNAHAYMLSKKGIDNLIQFNFKNKLMPTDELLPATYATHPREDLSFIWKDVIAYAPRSNVTGVVQKSNESTTTDGLRVEPDLNRVLDTLSIFKDPKEDSAPIVTVPQTAQFSTSVSLFDYFNRRDEWLQKYLCSGAVQKEWELIIDHPIPGVAAFNLFKPVFCEELIELAEKANKWTTARHDFYPTTDFVLSEIGFEEIYADILTNYVYPAMIHFYGLEGDTWRHLTSENFMAKYTPNSQAHLSLHHDSSDITALVNLSKPSDYVGGGTYFHLYKSTHIGQQGQVTLHPGRVSHRHGGRPVLDGKRYILVSFAKGKK